MKHCLQAVSFTLPVKRLTTPRQCKSSSTFAYTYNATKQVAESRTRGLNYCDNTGETVGEQSRQGERRGEGGISNYKIIHRK